MQNTIKYSKNHIHISLPLITAGMMCMLVWAILSLHQYGLSIFPSRNTLLHVRLQEDILMQKQSLQRNKPVTISFGPKTIPIEEATVSANNWPLWNDRVSHLAQSARPGEQGNIVLYAHNTKILFGGLKWFAETKTDFTIINSEGIKFTYTPVSVSVVSPQDLSILKNNDREELTVYTCTGLLDSKRLVVKAIRKSITF